MKSHLIYEYRAVLKTVRKGSYTTKKRYLNVMRSIVNDLLHIQQAPKTFAQMSCEQIKNLIAFWKNQGNNSATIINKLSVLRKYCKLAKCLSNLVSKKLTLGYLRNLGLACVLGGMTAFFLKPHNHNQLIHIVVLFCFGLVFSFFGILKGVNIMGNLGPTIGLIMLDIFGAILCTLAIFANDEKPKNKPKKHHSPV